MRRRGTRTQGPVPPDALPRCPAHLSAVARKEWRRLAKPLFDMGVLTTADRGAFAAYCQAWARWVEAERRLAETPLLLRTPSGYVQQSPWLSIANRQLELMGRYMTELGLTPAARTRVAALAPASPDTVQRIKFVIVERDAEGNRVERLLGPPGPRPEAQESPAEPLCYEIDSRL